MTYHTVYLDDGPYYRGLPNLSYTRPSPDAVACYLVPCAEMDAKPPVSATAIDDLTFREAQDFVRRQAAEIERLKAQLAPHATDVLANANRIIVGDNRVLTEEIAQLQSDLAAARREVAEADRLLNRWRLECSRDSDLMNDTTDFLARQTAPQGVDAMTARPEWYHVHHPLQPSDHIPAERKVVLAWLAGSALPFCAYIRYSAGDRNCPFFVVYHGNDQKGSDVVAWCDCLPHNGPKGVNTAIYNDGQRNGRGYPERKSATPQSRPDARVGEAPRPESVKREIDSRP